MQLNKFKNWVNTEAAKKVERVGFKNLPLRMRIGLIILLFSYALGYGASLFAIIFSGVQHKMSTGLVGGSICYIVSWPIGAIGLALAGRDCIKYPLNILAKLLKKRFPSYFDYENDPD